MPFTVTFKLNVTPLPENDIWFANAAAWTNYWANQPGVAVIVNPASTTIYVPQPQDTSLPVYDLIIDGMDRNIPSLLLHESLATQVTAIDQALQDLRTQLKAAGFISNAQ